MNLSTPETYKFLNVCENIRFLESSGPMILLKALYWGCFWGMVFTTIGFWPPRGLTNHTLKPEPLKTAF